MKPAAYSLVGLGLLLLCLSGVWTTFFTGASSWTPEKSAEWTKIKDRIHTLSFVVGSHASQVSMHSGPETGQAKAEYDDLLAKHAELTAEFYGIHDRPYTIAKILKWFGISLTLAGVIGVYAANQSR